MINWPVLPGTLFPAGPPGTPGAPGPVGIGTQGPSGPAGPAPWTKPAPWASNTSYTIGPPASAVVANGILYICTVPHVSSSSFDGTKWQAVLTITSINFQAPATGATVTATGTETDLIIDPAAALASLTVTLFGTPADGQRIKVYFSQAITAVTINSGGGKTVKGPPTTIPAGSSNWEFVFRATNNTWYC